MEIDPIVRYFDKTDPISCPYGNVRRIVTGGEGVANIHVVRITEGGEHFHAGYNETYYFLSGNGTLTLGEKVYPVRPGAVAVIPAKTVHSLKSDSKQKLEFVIFGIPPMSVEDDMAKPIKPL